MIADIQPAYAVRPQPIECVAYHVTEGTFDGEFNRQRMVQDGVHFGSLSQVMSSVESLRGPRTLVIAHIHFQYPARCKDGNDGWGKKIKYAKSAGKDGIVYLNQHDGADSLLVFYPQTLHVLSVRHFSTSQILTKHCRKLDTVSARGMMASAL